MTKLWDEEPRVRKNEFGKVIKPPTYSEANLAPVLDEQIRQFNAEKRFESNWSVIPEGGNWRVEGVYEDGRCHVATFCGPHAEDHARDHYSYMRDVIQNSGE
jgi:hypothetical protein